MKEKFLINYWKIYIAISIRSPPVDNTSTTHLTSRHIGTHAFQHRLKNSSIS